MRSSAGGLSRARFNVGGSALGRVIVGGTVRHVPSNPCLGESCAVIAVSPSPTGSRKAAPRAVRRAARRAICCAGGANRKGTGGQQQDAKRNPTQSLHTLAVLGQLLHPLLTSLITRRPAALPGSSVPSLSCYGVLHFRSRVDPREMPAQLVSLTHLHDTRVGSTLGGWS